MPYTKSFSDRKLYRKKVDTANGTSSDISIIADLIGSRTGERVPNWKAKIRNGSNATSPFSSDRIRSDRTEYGSCEVVYRYRTTPQVKRTDSLEGFVSPITSVSHLTYSATAANNEALVKILKKIKAETSHLNGLAFAGELRETIQMLKHPYRSVVNLANRHLDLLSKRKKGLRGSKGQQRERMSKIVSDTWLETNFGLLPLIKDTEEIAEAIARYEWLPPKKSKLMYRAGVSNKQVTPTSVATIGSGNKLAYLIQDSKLTEYSRQYVVGMSTSLTADYTANRRLASTLGFTLENFVPALWEVLPWSWLADYFSNIGDIVEASTTNTSSVTWVCMTDRVETTALRDCQYSDFYTRQQLTSNDAELVSAAGSSLGRNSLVRRTVTRVNVPSLGVPTFQLSVPGNWKQWANMGAVLLQRRKPVEASIAF